MKAGQAIVEKLRRLGEMSLLEMRFRLAHKLRLVREQWSLGHNGSARQAPAWWQLWDPDQVSNPSLRSALLNAYGAGAECLLPDYFELRTTPRFFFGSADRAKLAAAHRQSFPGRADELRAEADALCAHRLRILAYPEVTCGIGIPWRRDLVHDKESPLAHWSRLRYLDFSSVGDSKIVWEPNRHQHFFTLGQTYLLTGEERYAEECLAQWEDWLRENPYLRGINWASSLEVAFRAWSWLWTLFFLAGSRALTGARLGEMTRALAQHAEYIATNLSVYSSPNTHLLGEGFGLFVIGLMLPELRGAKTWEESGRAILVEQMQKQVREDGSHIEQSSYYHRYATDFFLCAALLAERNGRPFPAGYCERLARMVEFLLHTAWPSGRQPMTGDADGGRVLALARHDPNDHRATLSTAAVYFRRADLRRQAGSFHEETLWLLSPAAIGQFDELESAAPPEISRVYPGAGLASLRSGWDASARMLLFDCGPQGMGTCAHGHADALGFVCGADGVEWLVDPGTYVYTASHEGRDFFRSTRAHNTVTVDGEDQAEPVAVFKWRKIPQIYLERQLLLPHFELAAGRHNGYARLPEPVEHRRSVAFIKPDYWIITDELTGRGAHRFEFFFHFAPSIDLKPWNGAWLACKDGRQLVLVPPEGGLEIRLATGETSPLQGWYSEDYGHRQPAPVLIGTAQSKTPARFHWVLRPGVGPVPCVREWRGPGVGLTIESDAWTDCLAASGSASQDPSGELATDAELAFARWTKTGGVVRLVLVNGSRAASRGLLLQADRPVSEFDMLGQAGVLEIHAQPVCRMRVFAPGIAEVRLNGRPAAWRRSGYEIELFGED